MTVRVETGADGVCRITLDRPEAKHALTPEMRDTITDALRRGRTDPAVRAFLITATGDAFCAGMDLTASTVAAAGSPGFDPRTTAEALAHRGPGVHPRALGARQADRRGGQRDRGRAGRAPRARVRLRARAARDPVHLVVQPLGARRRRGWRVPAAAARRVAAGEGDGDARGRLPGRRSRGPRTRLPLRARRRMQLAGEAQRARRQARRRTDARARAVEAAPERQLRDRPRVVARGRRRVPVARDRVARPGRGHGRVSARSATPNFTGT